MVYTARKRLHQDDRNREMEDKYLGKTSESFMQSNVAFCDEKGAQRCLGFGNREAFCKLKQAGIQWHIDATFDIVPPDFYQLLIVSVYEESTSMFLPCHYILMTNKTILSYVVALSMMKMMIGNCDPGYVIHDFELAIPKALKKVFPNAKPTGCYFHFVQCITRRMIHYGIPQHIAFKEVDWFKLLTVVPKNEIFEKALPFIEFNILVMNASSEGVKSCYHIYQYRLRTITYSIDIQKRAGIFKKYQPKNCPQLVFKACKK